MYAEEVLQQQHLCTCFSKTSVEPLLPTKVVPLDSKKQYAQAYTPEESQHEYIQQTKYQTWGSTTTKAILIRNNLSLE